MYHSTISSKGQTTIPADIRAMLGLSAGDCVEYKSTKDGVLLRPRKRYTWRDLHGFLPRPERAVTIEEMNEAVVRAVTEKFVSKEPKSRK